MDVLIPLIIITLVLGWSVKRFKPLLWSKITSILKK